MRSTIHNRTIFLLGTVAFVVSRVLRTIESGHHEACEADDWAHHDLGGYFRVFCITRL